VIGTSTVPSSTACITNFEGASPFITAQATCQNVFENFISKLQALALAKDIFPSSSIQGSGEGCKYDVATTAIKMSYFCWYRLNDPVTIVSTSYTSAFEYLEAMNDGVNVFYDCASTMNQSSDRQWFTTEMIYIFNNNSSSDYSVVDSGSIGVSVGSEYRVITEFDKDPTTNNYMAELDLSVAMCQGCKARLLNHVQSYYSTTAGSLSTYCGVDPLSKNCVENAIMDEGL
jgi:hypothetical protein